MHRRNRHVVFSAKQAGAALVLDARTIKGVSDGGNIVNWIDIGITGYYFYVSRVAPVLKNNIQGGQPVVRFDANLLTGMQNYGWTNPSRYTWICTEIPKATANYKHIISTDNNSFNGVNFSVQKTGPFSGIYYVGTDVRGSSGVTDFQPAALVLDTPYVHSLGYDGNQLFFYRGDYASSTGVTISTACVRVSLGGRVGGYSDLDSSDLMQFMIFNSLLTKSLRRRFEIASFYAFKIKDLQNNTSR